MSKKMLIDARHPEETRVAVMSGGRVEDFDFETQSRKPLRGNIYLARITRVEPSLQAAFVEYGGNRHGFLAFSEIHPDYYQIPVSDREILRQAEALEAELAQKLAAFDKDVNQDLRGEDDEEEGETSAPAASDDEESEARAEASGDAEEDSGDDDKPARRGRRRRSRGGRSRRGRGRGDEARADDDKNDDDTSDSDDGETAAAAASDEEGSTHAVLETGEAHDAHVTTERPAAADGATPPDYAGEESGEDAGWHGLEEDALAPLPGDAAAETPKGDTDAVENESDEDDGDDPDKGRSMPLEDEKEPSLSRDLGDEDGVSDSDRQEEDSSTDEAEDTPVARAENDESDDVSDEDEDTDDADDEETEAKADETAEAKKSRAAEIAELEKRYDEARRARDKLLRNYKIQEVIKRRQILLVQVVKEERGNKGAALTTYLSLAGRYGVLMPNNARGGGVSRKITNATDRKRLRSAMAELNVPRGQGLIIRTAGAKRTKAEIKRDYDYLARLWDTIREQTLKSVAPCLIYEEASLIKRAIRDLYDKDISEILVEGDAGYREAKDFMKMLMPSHAKNVQPYREVTPLFLKHGVEQQLDEMYQPVVNLKSGGYLVIQQTEALISIDVNSGKATKERNVEATALKTNSEAAVEVARQCRLRDLAGLLVIDFIDMEENRNNRAVEKKLKDAMKMDRARIQLGSISNFGLLEMSRQRRRSGIVDGTTRTCPTCDGAGAVRSVEMAALRVLRAVEEAAIKDRAGAITVVTSDEVALYILNQKRSSLNRMEQSYGITVEVLSDVTKAGDQFELKKAGRAPDLPTSRNEAAIGFGDGSMDDDDKPVDAITGNVHVEEADEAEDEAGDDDTGAAPKSRRRRRRGGSDKKADDDASDVSSDTDEEDSGETADSENRADDDRDTDQSGGKKRRRRGRRGGRRNRKRDEASGSDGEESATAKDSASGDAASNDDGKPAAKADDAAAVTPDPANATDEPPATPEPEAVAAATATDAEPEPEAAPKPAEAPAPQPVADSPSDPSADSEPKKKRAGWWQRAFTRDE